MQDLNDLHYFAQVVRHGGFSAASRATGEPKASSANGWLNSRRDLGVRLIEDCHVILRGGKSPNYDAASVDAASAIATRTGLAPAIMIDASHANSGKNPENQPRVIEDVSISAV